MMPEATTQDALQVPANAWLARLAPYRGAHLGRSLWEIAVTAVPLVALWLLASASLSISVWLALALTVPTAVFLVRLFMIQHDCGHGTFFKKRATNDWLGRILGIVTMTPYDVWQRSHAVHHATTGNLDHRGTGDIQTLTVKEFEASSPMKKFWYGVYRHPFVLFGIGPAYLFLIQHRLPLGYFRSGWKYWASAMLTNLGIVALCAAIVWLAGLDTLIYVHLPMIAVAATIGVWLFYVQHQFEDAHWRQGDEWNVHEAALHGSSYYDLPPVLRWFTANIGMHHLHHLSSRIPFYRLPEIMNDYPELRDVKTVKLLESFSCAKLKLWDEDQGRLITFAEHKESATA